MRFIYVVLYTYFELACKAGSIDIIHLIEMIAKYYNFPKDTLSLRHITNDKELALSVS
ncbi:MAG: hypothetical protein ACRCZI_02065 [Cetobacterium sp.]